MKIAIIIIIEKNGKVVHRNAQHLRGKPNYAQKKLKAKINKNIEIAAIRKNCGTRVWRLKNQYVTIKVSLRCTHSIMAATFCSSSFIGIMLSKKRFDLNPKMKSLSFFFMLMRLNIILELHRSRKNEAISEHRT